MARKNFPIKVMMVKVGLDGHDRGVKVVARSLRDEGMEVVYLGMRLTSKYIAKAVIEEDVDVLGVSILSGAHIRLMTKLIDELKNHGAFGRVRIMVGGTIPQKDIDSLREIGVDGIFPVGTFTGEIVRFVRDGVEIPRCN